MVVEILKYGFSKFWWGFDVGHLPAMATCPQTTLLDLVLDLVLGIELVLDLGLGSLSILFIVKY